MLAKKIFFIAFLLISIILISFTLQAADIEEFKDCDLCKQKLEKLYEDEEIDTETYNLYQSYLAEYPEKLPESARCNLHKYYHKSIKEVLDNKEDYLNKKIKLKATFKGWGGPVLSRSDWMIEDSTASIVVSGSFPSGLNPANKEDIGKEVIVTGYLRKIENNNEIYFYLDNSKADSSREKIVIF